MNFDPKFVVEMFLDDCVSTVNRVIVATANIANENMENISFINEALIKEHNNHVPNLVKEEFTKDKTTREKGNSYEQTVKCYNDHEYLSNINMCTVQALINFLQDFVETDRQDIPLDKKVHIFLYVITCDLSLHEVGERFDLNKSTVSFIIHEISNLLYEQRFHCINWPSLEEQHVTAVKVNSRHNFPNCVGFLDACRLRLKISRKPNLKPDIILLQAVCDESMMFNDVHIGDVGNTKKYRVFKESPLSKELKNYIELDSHLLADSEYKLKKNLIIPFSNEEMVSNEEVKFNEIHWNARTYIGHAFQILKNRFKRLNYIDICKPDDVKTLLYATCVLHNFIMLHEGNSQLKEENNLNNESLTIDTNIVKTASEKRQFLSNYINYIDSTSDNLVLL